MNQEQLDRLAKIEREVKAMAREVLEDIKRPTYYSASRTTMFWRGKAIGALDSAVDALSSAGILCRVAFDLKEPPLKPKVCPASFHDGTEPFCTCPNPQSADTEGPTR